MRRDAPRIGVEVLLLGMILAVLGAAVALLIQAQSRITGKSPAITGPIAVAKPVDDPKPAIEPPRPDPIDLTPETLQPIEASIAKEKARYAGELQRTEHLLEAANLALDEARRLRLEEIRLRDAIAASESNAQQVEDRRDRFARERDVLAEKRDDARAALEKQRLRSRDGVAVLPYKGPNGTWRRPIAIECRGNTATLRPGGPSFSIEDMTNVPNPRRGPIVYAVAKAMVRARSTRTPDGAASVPYLMFVVRPDGIRPYYAARTVLEPLGITYGYELADADWDIEFPDLDDPLEWTEIPGSKPAATWPPPLGDDPSVGAGLAAKGTGGGSGTETGGRFPGGGGVNGMGATGTAAGSTSGNFGAGGARGTAGQQGFANPSGGLPRSPGAGLAARPLPSPGDGRGQGGTGSGATPWGGLGHRTADSLDVAELERLGRSDANPVPVPRDGRVPWLPGQSPPPALPAFQPTPGSGTSPSSGATGEFADLTRGGSTTAGDASGSQVAGQSGGGPASSMPPVPNRGQTNQPSVGAGGVASRTVGQPSPVVATDTLRDAIARRNGLVAPTVPGSASSSSPSGSQNSSTGGKAGPASTAGGSPGGQGGGTPAGEGRAGSGIDPFASQAFPIVVSCDRAGLTIHPGGETIAFDVISRDDAALPTKLRALVKAKQDGDLGLGVRPRVNFLVKPGGEVAYLKARWQVTTATSYPTTWQIVNRGGPRLSDLEAR